MPAIGVHGCATTGGVPDLYCPVLASGGNQLTGRRPRYRRDLFCMTSEDEPARTSGSLENLNKSVVTVCSNELTIRRPGQTIYARKMPGKDAPMLIIDDGRGC